MGMFGVLKDRLRALTGRRRVVDEIDSELVHHRERLADRLRSEGYSPAEAETEAARRLGDPIRLREAGYDVRGGGWIEAFLQDLRYAARMLRRTPAFTLTAVVTLALGIGANTAIFSVASGVLLRPLPYPNADRLAMVWMDNARISLREDWHSYPNYADYRDQNSTFDDLAIFNNTARTLTDAGDPERLIGAHSSANLFSVLGVGALHGRTYTPDEDGTAGASVIVLSHGLWQRRFGGRLDVLNTSISMSGRPMQIVGVMPDTFAFPSRDTQFWVPTAASEQQRAARGSLWLQVIGRTKPGVTMEQAQADLDRVNASLLQQFPNQKGYGIYVAGYREQIVGRIRPAILVLLGAVGCVLLIACANVANLLLARASVRQRELALRAAIGAGRGRLVRQLLTESLLISLAGGALGVALGWFGVSALVATAPPDLPRLDAIVLDWRVLVFTFALTLLTSVVFGLIPALQLARTNASQTMKEGARGSTALGRSLRRGLVAVEVALAVVLLVGAGLMLRSFERMQRVDLGFNPDNLLTARMSLWGQKYQAPAARVDFFRNVIARVESDPGVRGAAGVGTIFLSATPNSTNFAIEGQADFLPEEQVEVPVDAITPGYFAVMGVPLLAGRPFNEGDSGTAPQVVIINKTLADRFFPKNDAIGRRIKYGNQATQNPWMTIVGIVADTRRTGYESAVRPETYLPYAQSPDGTLTIVVRTAGEPASFMPALRSIARDVDPAIALQGLRPIDEQLGEMTSQRRLNTLLLTIFAVVAGLLAAVGVYGVVAYSVEQRTRELGVRVALGAPASRILGLIAFEVATLAFAGLALGLAAAVALSRSMTSLLYQVSATDPATFAAIAAIALLTAALASLVPAVRALRVDPVKALRAE
jgi:putative ABC transport system permease protein